MALYSAFLEKDAVEHLGLAQQAIGKAEEIAEAGSLKATEMAERLEQERERVQSILDNLPDIERNIALYQSTKLMRDALEQSCVAMTGDIDALVGVLIKLSSRTLLVAAGFSLADQYTICVYKAVLRADDCRYDLRLVEHLRAIECEKDTARTWPEGKGVAGVAFTNDREIVVADLSDESIRTVFQPSGLRRDYDDDRYQSIVAVPISVAGQERPWGVITATNDRPDHFNHNEEPGLKPEEAIRALANYAALAVAIMEARERAKISAPMVD